MLDVVGAPAHDVAFWHPGAGTGFIDHVRLVALD